MNNMRVLVTGAAGFVGQALVRCLQASGCKVTALVRDASQTGLFADSVQVAICEDLTDDTAYIDLLGEIDTVVHAAARTHVMAGGSELSALYQHSNVAATSVLAQAAAAAGVQRFIFLSSVKVHGEGAEQAYTENSAVCPEDDYGRSKLEAENRLQQIAADNPMEFVIIRPPLVYGAGVKGNFAALIRLVKRQWPLPLASVHNQRSFVALGNLVDFIQHCSIAPEAADQIFLVADDEALSTTALLREIAAAEGVKSRLVPVPATLLQFAASLLGKKAQADRLLGSLVIDTTKARKQLKWTPPLKLSDGIRECIRSEDKK